MDRFHIEGMTENELYAVFLAKVCHPVPAMHAFNADDNLSWIWGNEFEQWFWGCLNLFVDTQFSVIIDDTDIQRSRMQIDTTITWSRFVVESGWSSPMGLVALPFAVGRGEGSMSIMTFKSFANLLLRAAYARVMCGTSSKFCFCNGDSRNSTFFHHK